MPPNICNQMTFLALPKPGKGLPAEEAISVETPFWCERSVTPRVAPATFWANFRRDKESRERREAFMLREVDERPNSYWTKMNSRELNRTQVRSARVMPV